MEPEQPYVLVPLCVCKDVIRFVVNLAGGRVARRHVWERQMRFDQLVCDLLSARKRGGETGVAVGDNPTVRFRTENEERGIMVVSLLVCSRTKNGKVRGAL